MLVNWSLNMNHLFMHILVTTSEVCYTLPKLEAKSKMVLSILLQMAVIIYFKYMHNLKNILLV